MADDFWNDLLEEGGDSKSQSPSAPSAPSDNVVVKQPTDDKKIDVALLLSKMPKYTKYVLPALTKSILVPTEYQAIADKVIAMYSNLPHREYQITYQEVKSDAISIKSNPTPSPQAINQELGRIQAAKERMAEIFTDITRCYFFKKRMNDLLKDMWCKYSTAKSADSRKSEASVITAEFEMDFAETESLYKTCDYVIKQLEDAHDTVSRKITTMQIELKLSDMGRTALPDYDFNRFASKLENDEENSTKKIIDPSKSIEAEEQSF